MDFAILTELVGDDPAVLRGILESFLQSARMSEAMLREAIVQGNARAVAAAAHRLKSPARSIGAVALGDICAALEKALAGHDWPGMLAILPAFDASLQATLLGGTT